VAILQRFSPPGNLPDENANAWSSTVEGIVQPRAANFPQFYNPTASDTPDDAVVAPVVWPAFPGSLRGSAKDRLEIGDGNRGAQDEYCEWAVEKNDGKITRITFTTEVPEYFNHLFETDPDGLLTLYQQLIGPQVQAADLEEDGVYKPDNKWNTSTEGRPAHLVQTSNNLDAAVELAAQATILRERKGKLVTGKQELVDCGALGEPLRNSDPQIASAVNNAAASGSEITLQDPMGLYIDGLITGEMETPDGEDPGEFWTVERGDPQHVVRASYEVPDSRGYVVEDITIAGQPIQFGGQLAVRVRVRLDAIIKSSNHQPDREPCAK
jgi:hypothetical protein